jgi:hypothetical protein
LRLFAAIIAPATSNPPLANFSIATKKSYNFSLSEFDSFAPAHITLWAAFGSLPGQRPLTRVQPFSFSPPSRYPHSSVFKPNEISTIYS